MWKVVHLRFMIILKEQTKYYIVDTIWLTEGVLHLYYILMIAYKFQLIDIQMLLVLHPFSTQDFSLIYETP